MAGSAPTDEATDDRDEATICYPLRGDIPLDPGDELLMIRKRRGLGADLYNGPGGKVEPGETPHDAAVRETREEVGLDVGDLTKRAEFDFFFGDEHVFLCHVFFAREVAGTPETTEEAIPEWRTRATIPYAEMWEDDELWLPTILDGETVRGAFYFDGDGDELVDHEVTLGVAFEE